MPGVQVNKSGKAKNFKQAIKQFLGFIKPHRGGITVAVFFAIAAAVIGLVGPTLLREITNLIGAPINNFSQCFDENGNIIQSTYDASFNFNRVLLFGWILGAMFVVAAICNYLQGRMMNGITQKVAQRLRQGISVKINSLPLNYFDQTATGDVLSRVTNDVDAISSTLNDSFVTLFSAIAMLVGSVLAMFITNWLLALIAIASSLLSFSLMGVIIKNSQKYFLRLQQTLGDLNGHIEETYSGHNVIGVFNAKEVFNQQFAVINERLYKNAWRSQFYSGLMGPLMGLIGDISYITVCVVGGILAFTGRVDFGLIMAFILFIRTFTQSLRQLAQTATSFQSAAAASERVFEFLNEREMAMETQTAPALTAVKGDIVFDQVNFGYNGKKNIINNFSAQIKAGQKIAIVGPTGAGKTTIVNLLMRFYEVDSGKIEIDGQNIAEMKRADVHSLFGMVLQDSWLFGGTIYDNIVYNLTDVTRAEVEEACIATGLDHFIKTLPNGYDTVLTEENSLSAGQKQLITIARAMVKNAPLLILDEATSSVDTRTELIAAQAMDKLMQGRTSFVIAHRLSTILNADNILVLKDGEIIESGTHKQLMAKHGFYADLYNSQFEAI